MEETNDNFIIYRLRNFLTKEDICKGLSEVCKKKRNLCKVNFIQRKIYVDRNVNPSDEGGLVTIRLFSHRGQVYE